MRRAEWLRLLKPRLLPQKLGNDERGPERASTGLSLLVEVWHEQSTGPNCSKARDLGLAGLTFADDLVTLLPKLRKLAF